MDGRCCQRVVEDLNLGIDWSGNGSALEALARADLNRTPPPAPALCYASCATTTPTTLYSTNDWDILVYRGGSIGSAGTPADPPLFTPEVELSKEGDDSVVTDYAVSANGPPLVEIEACAETTCEITVVNPGTADDVHLLAASATRGFGDTSGLPAEVPIAASAESVFKYVVAYDPNGGFVTRGGWIQSPVGASVLHPDASGKASFGFVSKYKKGAQTPTGQTHFSFRAADLSFVSSSYDWLVVAGAKPQFKGSGAINGAAGYQFLLSGIDGQVPGGQGTDKFRIKIWETASGQVSGQVVYKNMVGSPDDASPTTVLGGGSTVIHRPWALRLPLAYEQPRLLAAAVGSEERDPGLVHGRLEVLYLARGQRGLSAVRLEVHERVALRSSRIGSLPETLRTRAR